MGIHMCLALEEILGGIRGDTTACCGCSSKYRSSSVLGWFRTIFAVILVIMYPLRIFAVKESESKEFFTSMSLWAHHFTTAAFIMLAIEHCMKGHLLCKSGKDSVAREKCTIVLYQLACVGQVTAFLLMTQKLSGTKK